MKLKSLLLGILVGGVSAGIGALLTAPASGKETRQNLKEKKDLLLNQFSVLKKNLAELKDAATYASKEGKEAITTFASDVKSSIDNWKNEISPHQQQLKKEIQDIEKKLNGLEQTLNANL
ncbi:hypothetical protein C0966_01850 [Bacillus methanolicus]|uniref:YtxH domain-containing protein n=1 Tax=Bacillus methanolicus TaxID=1471 RepID=UPI0023806ABB|nr:YtxH domain-containing protein [Bacillus methanolicus]MDE3838128.1 hypothetical protein [Bacillus methanolicus]